MRACAAFLPFAAASLLAFTAAAAPPPSLDLRGFHAPTDPNSGLYLEPADSPASGDWNAALWLNYVYRPVVLRDAQTNAVAFEVIHHQLTGDLTANLGLWHRLAVGFDLPVLLYQGGDQATAASTAVLGGNGVPTTALGDLGLDAKVTLVRPTGGEFGGFALALHERFTLPTADPASYVGGGGVTSETRLLAEYRLVAVAVHAAVGARFQKTEAFACAGVPDDQCPTRFGQELPFGLGLVVRPQAFGVDPKGRWMWFLETHGYLPLAPNGPFKSAATSEAQLDLGARYALPHDFSVLAGVETALVGGIGNPLFRGTLAVGWAPREHDLDHDGIPDDVDQCPEIPEDKDGYQDFDGCPDGDNDDDGIPDADDRCPNVKEDEDGFQDEDGCPDPDNDGDGILDAQDACPNVPGPPSPDPKKNGCPVPPAAVAPPAPSPSGSPP